MISTDLRNLTSTMRAFGDEPVSPATMKLFLGRLEAIVEEVERFERMPVPGSFKLSDQAQDDKVVFIRAHTRLKPQLVRSQGGEQ
ncbi:MAG: hypothetical protein KF765_12400 [Parvibaculaceae bacterium]|nr:hypothetical protein [Parvibaculaceae bacterium]